METLNPRPCGLTAPSGRSADWILLTACVFFFFGVGEKAAAQVTPTITVTPSVFYYVSKSGNDTNAGTSASPWLTIQHAANTALPGSTVYVETGSYNELVTINVSGSAAAGFTTFENYLGDAVTIDGTGLSIPGGQNGLITIQDQNFITIQGFVIQNYTSNTANVPIGIYITGSDSYIQILNNQIQNISTTYSHTANANALGLAVYGSSMTPISNLLISGNVLTGMTTGYSETLTINGNVQYWTVSNNVVHDNNNIGMDAIGFEGVGPASSMCGSDRCDRARDGEFIGNTVYNVTTNSNPSYGAGSYSADGIYVDGGLRITIEQNTVHNTDLGIETTSENPGGEGYTVEMAQSITVRNNIVYENNTAGLSVGGYANSGDGGGGTSECVYANNTLYDNDTAKTGEGEFQIQYHASDNLFVNNILYANTQGVYLYEATNPATVPVTMNYNLYYSTVTGTWGWNGSTYTGLTAFKGGSSQGANSLSANPDFVSLSTPDFHVLTGSPALGAGDDLGTAVVGAVDFAGNPRIQGSSIDMGAYESGTTSTASSTPTTGAATNTSTPTSTHTNSPTSSPTPTGTNTFTGTSTSSTTNTATNTATNSPTSSPTLTATWTSSGTPTNTLTATSSSVPSGTPTPTSTFSPTLAETGTATLTPTNTFTNTATNTATNTSTFTPIQTASQTPTNTFANTATNTAIKTSTFTQTPTASQTSANSATFTQTLTASPTRTPSASMTPSFTNTPTVILTPTESSTDTSVPVITNTSTPAVTPVSTVVIDPPYPDPITGAGPLNIYIESPRTVTVTWDIFTMAFRKITGGRQVLSASGNITWDLNDKDGNSIANGLYYIRVKVAGGSSTVTKILKVLIIR